MKWLEFNWSSIILWKKRYNLNVGPFPFVLINKRFLVQICSFLVKLRCFIVLSNNDKYSSSVLIMLVLYKDGTSSEQLQVSKVLIHHDIFSSAGESIYNKTKFCMVLQKTKSIWGKCYQSCLVIKKWEYWC